MENIFDSFDSLIYIIITIVAFAISALGKKKKRDAKRNNIVGNVNKTQPKGRPFFSNLEQLLKEEMGLVNEDDQNEYVNEFVDEDYIHENKVSEEGLDQAQEEIKQKAKTPYGVEYEDTSKVFSNSILESDLTEPEEEQILEGFNIRDAVIYSEIINRKEY